MEVKGVEGWKMHETDFWIGVYWRCHFGKRWIQRHITSGLREGLNSAI